VPRAEFIRRMRHFKFNASFREKFQYNNLMYVAAAYLVEKIAEQRWEEFVAERIFGPLGMDASNFQPEPLQPGQFNATGYRVDRDETGAAQGLVTMPIGQHTELSPGAAGALFSTLADLTQWLKVQVNEGRAGDVRLVSPDTLKQMHLPQTIVPGGGFNEALLDNTIFTYGMGWFIEPYRGYTLVQHGGNVEGHSLMVGFVPQEHVGVVVLTNIGMLPLRDVLLYEGLDRALELPQRDWNRRFHEMHDPLIEGQAKAKQTAAAERVDDAPPTHPLAAYTGVYEADGYPDFAVREAGDGEQEARLEARTVGSLNWSALRHYHYNVFEWHLADFDIWWKVRFRVGDTGDVDAVSVPIEPAVEDVVFRRKAPELTEDLIAALVGVYDLPMDGLSVTVSAHEGKLYAAQTGQPAEQMSLYKVTDALAGFKLERTRLDFVRADGRFTRLLLKASDMTLEAPRRSVPSRYNSHAA
ncbi:MAG TPA: serine hydrolase, partial [Candidatus Sulfomarinibacteraceae bacterium]|nr:serine hydrolase [Candidatus Sulfomarinibacteraceae bacterium]